MATQNLFMSQEINSCQKKLILVRRNLLSLVKLKALRESYQKFRMRKFILENCYILALEPKVIEHLKIISIL